MELWQAIHFVPDEELVNTAVLAEDLRFTGIALGDHLLLPEVLRSPYPYAADGSVSIRGSSPFPDAWVAIAAMATATTALRFATHVYVLPLRDPVSVAKSVCTAALVSGHRVTVGIGVGWLAEEFEPMGVDFHTRGRRTDEMLALMRALWAGGPVTFHGEWFHVDGFEMSPAPGRPVPVIVGGHTDAALRRAAREDGWIATRLDRAGIAAAIERIRALRAEAGDDRPVTALVSLNDPPTAAGLMSLAADGVTGVVIPPRPEGTSAAERSEAMRTVAARFHDAVGI